ncbi:MAG: outer membrane beta-barrel protein [Acidobacteriota bacterium]
MKWATLLLVLTSLGMAETPRTVEVKGSAGYTGFTDESIDGHLQTGFSVRYYLTRRFSIEPEFQYLRGENRHYDLLLIPNVNWDFRGQGRVIPYITGGVGWLRSTYGQFRPTFSSNEGFLQIGTGVKTYISDRWYVAPEFRVGFEFHFRASAAIGYTFGR